MNAETFRIVAATDLSKDPIIRGHQLDTIRMLSERNPGDLVLLTIDGTVAYRLRQM